MTNPFFDDDRETTNDELRLQELLRQLINLSGDGEVAGRIMLLAPDGEFVGDVKLSAEDIETLADGLMAINTYRADSDPNLAPAAPLPICEDDLTAENVDDLIGEFQHFLANGGDLT